MLYIAAPIMDHEGSACRFYCAILIVSAAAAAIRF